MAFSEFLNQAWTDHAATPKEVAARLTSQGLPLVTSPADLLALVALSTHTFGEHLGNWADGLSAFKEISKSTHADDEVKQALARSSASLEFASGSKTNVEQYSTSDQVRILSVAASALVGQKQIDRAKSLFESALAKADGLPATDPANRSVAVTGHNLACEFEEKESRGPSETAFMILAAQASRKFWELAGTWIHVERSEYRLANTYLKAGDVKKAVYHAEECVRMCHENNADADELKYAVEILAKAKQASQH